MVRRLDPGQRPAALRAAAMVLCTMLLAGGCRGASSADGEPAESAGAVASTGVGEGADTPADPAHGEGVPPAQEGAVVGITHPDQLERLRSPETITHLDLSLSPADVGPRLAYGGIALTEGDACEGLDLHALAEQLPALRSLRVAGCASALHAGLGAFAPTLRELELADLSFDGPLIARVAQLEGLETLTLTRVRATAEPLGPLASKLRRLQSLTLRDLEKDSVLGDLLGDLRTVQHVRLEGEWAGHRAMTSLSHDKALVSLTLADTRIGNFSLNQLDALAALRTVDWEGPTFNDMSPLYVRSLAIEHFRCACPNFGEAGLRHLRYLPALRSLDLPVSRIRGAGFSELSKLERLETVRLAGIEVDADALAGLASLPALRQLDLEMTQAPDPTLPHLGELVHLEALRLRLPTFGDAGAAQLATLTRLNALDLRYSRISDAGLTHLAALQQLLTLDLGHTRVTNRGLAQLAELPRLRTLHLDHTETVDEGVRHLAAIITLEDLRLDHTLVTDAGLVHLLALERLTRLGLRGTVVTARGVQRLESLPSLVDIDVRETKAER